MLAGPRKYKPQRKRYLRKNPNSEAAVPAVEGGRKPGRLLGLVEVALMAPLWSQKPHLSARCSTPILPGQLHCNKTLHPTLAHSSLGAYLL